VRTQTAFTPKRLVPLDDGADYLGITKKTLRRWIAEGRITGYRVGGKTVRVDLHEVDALARPIPTAGDVA
jgi:excisionase family DNA binding protein